MPIDSGFFDAVNEDRVYTASDFNSLLDGVISTGYFPNVGERLVVTPGSAPNQVIVGTGGGWLKGHWFRVESREPVTLQAPHGSLMRVDWVGVELDEAGRYIGMRSGFGSSKNGIYEDPESSYFYPRTNVMPIAFINRPPGVSQIQQNHIRMQTGSSLCPVVTSPVKTIDYSGLEGNIRSRMDQELRRQVQPLITEVRDLKKKVEDTISKLNQQSTPAGLATRVQAIEAWNLVTKLESQYKANLPTWTKIVGEVASSTPLYVDDAPIASFTPDHYNVLTGRSGDRFLPIGTRFGSGSNVWRLAGYDLLRDRYANKTPSRDPRRTAVFIMDETVNSGASNQHGSGWENSGLRKSSAMSTCLSNAQKVFGADKVLEFEQIWPTGISGSNYTSIKWGTTKIDLPTEVMIVGSRVFSAGNSYTTGGSQLPLFQLQPSAIRTGTNYWTRDASDATNAVYIHSTGYPGTDVQSATSYHLRPIVCVG